MISMAKIIGGSAGTKRLTKHLMNNTLAPEMATLAAYYGRGAVIDNDMLDAARAIADGEMTGGEATDILVAKAMEAIPEPSAEEQEKYTVWAGDHWTYNRDLDVEREDRRLAIEGRISYRLDVLAERIEADRKNDT